MEKLEELYKRNQEAIKEVIEKIQEKYRDEVTPQIDRLMIVPTFRPEHFMSKPRYFFMRTKWRIHFFILRIKNYILRRKSPWQNWLESVE